MKVWTDKMWEEWQNAIEQSQFEDAAVTLLIEEVNEKHALMSKSDMRSYRRRIAKHIRNIKRYNKLALKINKRYDRYMLAEMPPRHRREKR